MARRARVLGKYELPPKMRASEAVKLAREIAARYKEAEFSDESLAAELGHDAAKSGAFRQKIADLRKYGVIVGRGAVLHASPQAMALYSDHPGEGEKAALEMMLKVPIFKAIRERVGATVPDERGMVSTLLDITGAPRPEIEREAGSIRELYTDACGTVPSMRDAGRPVNVTQPPGMGAGGSHSYHPESGVKRFESSTEDYQFSVVDELDAIESLAGQLEARKKVLERRRDRPRPGAGTPSPDEG